MAKPTSILLSIPNELMDRIIEHVYTAYPAMFKFVPRKWNDEWYLNTRPPTNVLLICRYFYQNYKSRRFEPGSISCLAFEQAILTHRAAPDQYLPPSIRYSNIQKVLKTHCKYIEKLDCMPFTITPKDLGFHNVHTIRYKDTEFRADKPQPPFLQYTVPALLSGAVDDEFAALALSWFQIECGMAAAELRVITITFALIVRLGPQWCPWVKDCAFNYVPDEYEPSTRPGELLLFHMRLVDGNSRAVVERKTWRRSRQFAINMRHADLPEEIARLENLGEAEGVLEALLRL